MSHDEEINSLVTLAQEIGWFSELDNEKKRVLFNSFKGVDLQELYAKMRDLHARKGQRQEENSSSSYC